MIFSFDTESTGLDLYHGCKPFFVTICYEDGNQSYWEWDVNPLTREPSIPNEDIKEIQSLIDESSHLVLQNSKFDVQALSTIGITLPYHKVHDTLIASHILASILPHDLTSLGIQYLGKDISKYEESLKKIVNEARRHARSVYPDWMIAKEGLPCIPSAKATIWRSDYWLPRAVAVEEPEDHSDGSEYHTVLAEYSNADSALTMKLWPVLERELQQRGLWKVYLAKMESLPAALRMERRGITISRTALKEKKQEYIRESEQLSKVCNGIAESYNYELILPKSGRNKSLSTFIFNKMKVPEISWSDKTGEPSLDADTMDTYKSILQSNTRELLFIRSLSKKAEYDKAISMLETYERFLGNGNILHPNFNVTGTVTTRWSSSNPNAQNCSKQSTANLRKIFGPSEGRVWYSLDAQNIELRIPAYEAGERELIEVFDHPEKGPYFSSYHLVIFDILHPELFKKHGKEVKTLFEDTYYQRVKNGNFARQYGAQERKVDLTYGVQGGYQKIAHRFPKIDQLNQRMIAYANKYGYVETIPDASVSEKGYPLMTERTEYGKVSPTVPFCYHVSGTAGWWMTRAVIKTDRQLEEWREKERFDAHLIIQVHDEAVFDFPQGDNQERVMKLKSLMESCGRDIGIPTPVSVEKHIETWAVGEAM